MKSNCNWWQGFTRFRKEYYTFGWTKTPTRQKKPRHTTRLDAVAFIPCFLFFD